MFQSLHLLFTLFMRASVSSVHCTYICVCALCTRCIHQSCNADSIYGWFDSSSNNNNNNKLVRTSCLSVVQMILCVIALTNEFSNGSNSVPTFICPFYADLCKNDAVQLNWLLDKTNINTFRKLTHLYTLCHTCTHTHTFTSIHEIRNI